MQEKLSGIPEKPGIYIFRDGHGKVLYVGKAKALRTRVRSYFQKSSGLDQRKTAMIRDIRDFDYTVTGNELEAFVLEANFIKQFRPRYNVLLRDDKSYPYLKLSLNETWPRLEVVRRIERDGSKYFGPYVPAGNMWNILSFIRNNYPIRTCRYSLEKRMRPCIQHQIKKCIAPCSGSVRRDEYMGMVQEIRLLLEGKNRGLLTSLGKKMAKLSEEMRYEEAAIIRDRIRAIERISESQKVIAPELGDIDVIGLARKADRAVFKILFIRNGVMIGSRHFPFRNLTDETDAYLAKNFISQFYGKELIPPSLVLSSAVPEDQVMLASWLTDKKGAKVHVSVAMRGLKRELLEMAEENAEILVQSEKEFEKKSILEDVAAFLHLGNVPGDIGAFDISNISGKEAVGSFVCWSDGEFRKDRYRHIRMDEVAGPDDYAMMREMVRRTLANLGDDLPDLIIIDGGRGHLDAAAGVFQELGIGRDIIGVAKDPDRVFLRDVRDPLGLEEGNAVSLLLRKIRDEAHRFAISYHKKLRSKKTFESPLEKIPGVGKQRRLALLRHFGSIGAIRNAAAEEIAGIRGFHKKLAESIIKSLADGKSA